MRALKHILLKPWLPSLTLSALLLLPSQPAEACAWSDYEDGSYYTFFAPEMHDFKNLEPFHFTFDRLYNYDLLEPGVSAEVNLQEWLGYFGGNASIQDLDALIYKSEWPDLNGLLNFVDGKSNTPPDKFKDMALTARFKSGQYREALEYLLLAKEIEPLATYYYDEWSDEPKPEIDPEQIAQKALRAAEGSRNTSLRMRYAYQAVRVLHYNDFSEQAVAAWEQYMLPLEGNESVIWWWSLSDYAGALRNLGRQAEAAYHFSRVFEHCPSRRIQAWYSWNIGDEQTWEQSLGFCRDNHQRSMLYFLRSVSPNAVSMEEMEEMQALEPNSVWVEMLVLREINKIERNLLGYPFEQQQPFFNGFGREYSDDPSESIASMKQFVDQALHKRHQHNKDFWVLTDAYLYFLSGQFTECRNKLNAARGSLKPESKAKADLIEIAVKISTVQKTDAATEDALYEEVQKVRKQLDQYGEIRLANFLDEGMALVYEFEDDFSKGLLARNCYYRLWDKSSVAEVDGMLAFVRRPKRSNYERMLVERLGEDAEARLMELRGTRLMAEDRFDEAIQTFQSIPEAKRRASETFQLEDDPFRGSIRDVVYCEYRDCEAAKYDKLSFALRVQELRKKTLTDKANISTHYLELGHAFYNTTYFGSAWRTLDYYRSGSSWYSFGESSEGDGYFQDQFDINNFDEVVSMEIADRYYRWALETATDKEIAAEACFHVAKTEQNIGYLTGYASEEQERSSFRLMRDQYRGTRFYKRAIRECKYFSAYASR